jgi:hypothetical protein
MREFIEYIVKHLVERPEKVQVFEVKGEHVSVYEIRVARSDKGLVIGRKGVIAYALRRILNAASAKKGERIMLEII